MIHTSYNRDNYYLKPNKCHMLLYSVSIYPSKLKLNYKMFCSKVVPESFPGKLRNDFENTILRVDLREIPLMGYILKKTVRGL